jgi:apolipoprotein N-acyltransferase
MKLPSLRSFIPEWKSLLLTVLSAVLLILAFPDFDCWYLAWFGLVPLVWGIERESGSPARSFVLGWLCGVVCFFGTCWWLAYAPIHYAAFPPLLAYFLLFCVTAVAAIFPGLFGLITSIFLRRFGAWGFLLAPFVWTATEFARYWITGNNWNAVGYSQAFGSAGSFGRDTDGIGFVELASVGGSALVSFACISINGFLVLVLTRPKSTRLVLSYLGLFLFLFGTLVYGAFFRIITVSHGQPRRADVLAIQPDVPMSGLSRERWLELRRKHVQLTEAALRSLRWQFDIGDQRPTTVIFPESPMNFAFEEDPEFQRFVSAFAAKNNVNVLFNSAEPDPENKKYFNSAVLVGTDGSEIVQYDKIYLLPFGESVPAPLQAIVPAFVGSFSYGKNYNMVPLGEGINAGVMICFESHFGGHAREFVKRGADVMIEMTNDGYLGPTPVLRQHLANAVFRAVETGRPVLRVTNVGITAYIDERGEVIDPADSYTEATRVWSVSKSDGHQTFYVKYGDWFAWLCTLVTIAFLMYSYFRRRPLAEQPGR